MKKRITILKGDRSGSESTAEANYAALSELALDNFTLLGYCDLAFMIDAGGVDVVDVSNGSTLLNSDLVYIRDFHNYEHERNAVALILKQHGRKFINADVANFQHISKLTQYITFQHAGLPTPKTLYSRNHAQLAGLLREYNFEYPVVAKSIVGSNGSHNYVINNEKELIDRARFLTDNLCLIQEAIPNDYDYRVIIADDECLLAYKRIRTNNTHLNNVKFGASREVVGKPSTQLIGLARKAAQSVGRNLAGVDIIENNKTGEQYILEVNYNFGMHELTDDISSIFYEKLATYLHTIAKADS